MSPTIRTRPWRSPTASDVINAGELLQFAPGRELYDAPRTQFVANFLGESNIMHGTVVVANGRPRVELAGREVDVVIPDGARYEPGDRVLVSVRPEQMALDAPEADPLPATVAEKVFLGNAFNVFLRIDPDLPCLVRGTDRGVFDRLTPGQQVLVSWQPEQGRILAS